MTAGCSRCSSTGRTGGCSGSTASGPAPPNWSTSGRPCWAWRRTRLLPADRVQLSDPRRMLQGRRTGRLEQAPLLTVPASSPRLAGQISCGRSGPLLVCVGGAGLTRAVERRASQALPDLHEGSPVSESDEVLANDRFAPLSERRSRAVTGPAPKTSPPRHASTPGSSYCEPVTDPVRKTGITERGAP